jgi:hypothetical protein
VINKLSLELKFKKVGGGRSKIKKIIQRKFSTNFSNYLENENKRKRKMFSSSELFLPNSKIFFAKNDTVSIIFLHFLLIKNISSELQK